MTNARFATNICRKCITSLSVADMSRFAAMAYPNYDIYEKGGYPRDIPWPKQDAANRIVSDMETGGFYLDFVEVLVRVSGAGFMGKRYEIPGLNDVIDDIIEKGYSFDKISGQFFENQQERITKNWGRLLEGDERQMAIMRLDIAGSSVLVKGNPEKQINRAYGDLREIITKAVVSRLGRLWSWDGDGALAAFMLGNHSRMAIFAGIEILNEMFFYNRFSNPLNSNIKLRLAVHSGSIAYSASEAECLKTDTVRKVINLESNVAVPNSFVISDSLALTQDQALLNIFSDPQTAADEKFRIYRLTQMNG